MLIFYAAHLEARVIEIQHRGTNKLIVNPPEELRGEIRSTGDVISVNRPPFVNLLAFIPENLFLVSQLPEFLGISIQF